MAKLRLAVLFGGASSEHDVSLMSAGGVLSHIDRDKYELYLLGITKDGQWYLYTGPLDLLPGDRWVNSGFCERAVISPDASVHGIVTESGKTIRLDAVFPVLHGKNGEDGTLQGLLQLAGLPFVGCASTACGVCMDKRITNAMADVYGIAQVPWCSTSVHDYRKDPAAFRDAAVQKLGFPIFVKPANAGSSVGISKAGDMASLEAGIEKAFREDNSIILEAFADGFEVECAVLGNDDPVASDVGEILSANEFYDYEAKYFNAASKTVIPAGIGEEKRREVAEAAVRAFKAFGCAGLARVDFFVSRSDGRVLFNEINTLPGFTPISMYSMLFEAAGVPYSELIDRLVDLAVQRGTDF